MTVLQELFSIQQSHLNAFFSSVNQAQAEVILKALLDCKGSIFLSGIGKSGIIAEKIAMTMISTGTKAFYLPACNLLHGDIGIIGKDDVFIMISKSGETRELLSIIPYIRNRKALMIAWVSNKESSLAKASDLCMELPVEKELCPFGLAPTTSTIIQLIFGDVLAVALMRKRSFTVEDYAHNHPAGSIGTQITQTVEDVMVKELDLPLCRATDKLKDVLVELSRKKCGCLLIVDEDKKIKGVFTDGDLRRALQNDPQNILEEMMENLMTRQFLSVEKDDLLHNAMKMMQRDEKKWVSILPVVSQEKLVGLLRMHDIVHVQLT